MGAPWEVFCSSKTHRRSLQQYLWPFPFGNSCLLSVLGTGRPIRQNAKLTKRARDNQPTNQVTYIWPGNKAIFALSHGLVVGWTDGWLVGGWSMGAWLWLKIHPLTDYQLYHQLRLYAYVCVYCCCCYFNASSSCWFCCCCCTKTGKNSDYNFQSFISV